MKKSLIESDAFQKKSRESLEKLKEFSKRRAFVFMPQSAALLIVDMQRYFLDRRSHAFIPDAPLITGQIKNLSAAFLKMNLPVILTRHINTQRNAKLMGKWWKDVITEKSRLSHVIPELDFQGATVIKKTQYDAFYRTNLENILKRKKVKQVVITGVATHLCCETTARSAFMRGFTVFLPVDGTATFAESFLEASLLNLAHGFAIPVLCEELMDRMEVS